MKFFDKVCYYYGFFIVKIVPILLGLFVSYLILSCIWMFYNLTWVTYPDGYKTIDPYYDSQSKSDLRLLRQKLQNFNRIGFCIRTHCQLCGHPIRHVWIIQNDEKKCMMIVGSECWRWFGCAEHPKKTIKKFKDNKVREEFREWYPGAIEEIGTFYEYDKSGEIVTTWEGEKKLVYDMWKLRQKMQKTVSSMATSRKLKNMMKKFEELKKRYTCPKCETHLYRPVWNAINIEKNEYVHPEIKTHSWISHCFSCGYFKG